MKWISSLFAATAAIALAAPAQATLLFAADVNGTAVIRCTDNQAAAPLCPGGDTNPAIGTLALANNSFLGVQLNGSVQSSQGTPANPSALNILNSSSLNIINNTGALVHIDAAVGDTDFTPVATQAFVSASGTFQTAVGSTVQYQFFNDPLNGQGAENPFDLPGALLDTFNATALLIADAYAFASNAAVFDGLPFSMTQSFVADIVAGGQIVGNSQTEIKAAPEPASLAILGTGLIALWGFAHRRNRKHMNDGAALPA